MSDVMLVGPSWPFRGGIARTTTALAGALASRGSLERFVIPVRQYSGFLYPGSVDVDRDACPRFERAEPSFGVLEPWTWPRVLRSARATTASAIVLPYWTFAWAPFDLALQTAAQRPVVGIVHNPADHDAGWLARRAARAVLSRCAGFLCHAESVASTLRERWPGLPVTVHPLPPDRLEAFSRKEARDRLAVPEEAVAFLFFGLVRPYKGLEVLLEAFSRLPPAAPVVLLLAGEAWGQLAREIPQLLQCKELRNRVIARLEWVPEREASTWFAAADVAVLPYRSATGSAVAAQALGHGLPLIGTRVGGIAEVIEDGGNGMLVPPSDVTALVGACERMLDGGLRGRLREGARATARRWTWSTYADALVDLVSGIGSVDRRSRPTASGEGQAP